MALQDIFGGIKIPSPQPRQVEVFTPVALDLDGEECACVFAIPKTGNIHKVGLLMGTITQMTNALSVGIETIDAATGFPTGAAYGGMVADTSKTPNAATEDDTFLWFTLGTDAAATVGDNVAVVAKFDSFQAGDNIELDVRLQTLLSSVIFPYVTAKLSGNWTDQTYSPNFAIEYDDGSIEWVAGATPYATATLHDWDMNNSPDRRGLRFKVPFNCRMSGVWVLGRLDQDWSLVLYDTDGTTDLTAGANAITHDKDIRGSGTSMIVELPLVTKVILTKDTYYRLVLLPTTTGNIRMYEHGVTDDGANATMEALPMGESFHYTSVNGAPSVEGDWTNSITSRPRLGIIIDQLDDGVGGAGGGLITHPGMSGGMRG